MNFKKIFLLVCFFVCLSGAVICASDVGETEFDTDFNESHFQCCSFAIQEKDETVFAFRQDAELSDDGVVIHNDTLNDREIIVQEIEAPDTHFIHAMITEDGWIASHGGESSNDTETEEMENIAREMLSSKKISSDSLSEIQKIFNKYGYGHFFIKSPDGKYGVVYNETVLMGNLNIGDFLVVPNEYYGFSEGKYTDYSEDPVDAIVKICSYENSGTNRRNVYSYDYKLQDTDDGKKYGVNVYVANDNGQNVGLNTSEIVSYFYFNNDFYSPSAIPENPDKLYVGDYIFENQSEYYVNKVKIFQEIADYLNPF
ncbi:hypothetical protein [uncultured Methanobrevibacter sp.]|uniref:hypothetical protein n=1 Tax=uncultured Methanobrevibacter sp. TaxID=253161 RepID=UPI0025EAD101|nr:hypothetical protein [uncultured Methanobrevibacter sp.]